MSKVQQQQRRQAGNSTRFHIECGPSLPDAHAPWMKFRRRMRTRMISSSATLSTAQPAGRHVRLYGDVGSESVPCLWFQQQVQCMWRFGSMPDAQLCTAAPWRLMARCNWTRRGTHQQARSPSATSQMPLVGRCDLQAKSIVGPASAMSVSAGRSHKAFPTHASMHVDS